MIVRVTEPGKAAFQLRKGEQGLSVFDTDAVNPPLTEAEILDAFKLGSQIVVRSGNEIEQKGLRVVSVPGGEVLPQRLRDSHQEIPPAAGMSRVQFKRLLKELE